MAIWTNANWELEATDAGKLTKLIAFRAELQDAVTLGVSGNGHSVNAADVLRLLESTIKERDRLEAKVGAADAPRPTVVTTRTRTARRAPRSF